MKSKKCHKCGKMKSFRSFTKVKRNADGLSMQCKACHNKYYKKYRKNHEAYSINYKRKNTLYVLTVLKLRGCIDCGEKDPVVLDFDHVKGTKTAGISALIHCIHASLSTIKKEISKCEVRCSNCHRIKTAKERNYYSYLSMI